MKAMFKQFIGDEAGATAIEYGLIAALIGVGIVVGLNQVKGSILGLYTNINSGLN
jgi:pilus assembly protein Flp/PilA